MDKVRAKIWTGMKKSLLSLVLATGVIPALVISAEDMSTYLCIEDQATGYKYVDGEWVQTKFKGGSKYIFKGSFDSANSKGEWYEFGKDGYWPPNCEVDALYAKCKTTYGHFTLRSNGLSFTGHQIYPYLNKESWISNFGGVDDVYLGLGKCSKIQ
jgi:hypothetical protein